MRLYEISRREIGRKLYQVGYLTPGKETDKKIEEHMKKLASIEYELQEIEKDIEYNRRKLLLSRKKVTKQPSAKIFFMKVTLRQEEQRKRTRNLDELRKDRIKREKYKIVVESKLYKLLTTTDTELLREKVN